MNRWALFIGGIALSIAVTVLLWSLGFPGFFLFLAFPFFFLPFGSSGDGARVRRRCPACGRRSSDPEERHCKRDGSPMTDEPW